MAGHLGDRKINDSMRRELYWPQKEKDMYNTVINSSVCARNSSRQRLKTKLQHFRESGTLEFVVVDILWPLPRTTTGNQYFILITDRFLKLTGAIPASNTIATDVANVLFKSWIISYGVPMHVLMDNNVQLTSGLFATLCTMLCV